MWIAVAAMINATTKKCWLLLGAFVAIKILSDALSEVTQFNLRTHLKTLFHTLLIALFLTYYKSLLMFFDQFIASLCVFDGAVFHEAFSQATEQVEEAIAQDNGGWRSRFASFWKPIKDMWGFWVTGVGLLSHSTIVAIMHYVKAVTLLIVVQFGPLAALFSLLPGPFRRSFSTWAKSYVNVTCWTITLNIFLVLAKTFASVSRINAGSLGIPLGETLGYTCLSIVLGVAIFLTPTWTAKFISGATVANLSTGLSLAAGKAGKAVQLKA